MKPAIVGLLALAACAPTSPPEHYGFVALLGRDTISVERVTRQGTRVTSDGVDRFPRVRRRHTEIELGADGGIERLVMDIHTPSEPENQRDRHVVAEVTTDSVRITKRDGTGLGLTIVKKVVMDHGGSIEAGKGTLGGARIKVVLPREGSTAARAALEREQGPESGQAAAP